MSGRQQAKVEGLSIIWQSTRVAIFDSSHTRFTATMVWLLIHKGFSCWHDNCLQTPQSSGNSTVANKTDGAPHMKFLPLASASLLAATAFFSTSAQAAAVNCPINGSGTRVFTLTTAVDSACLASGDGNLQGQINQPDAFTSSPAGAGYVILDKDEAAGGDALSGIENLFSVTGVSAASGTFTIDASLWLLYDSLAIGFKVGTNLTPDWAVFGLASGTLTGNWSNAPKQGAGLSHANIYGIPKTNRVPEPMSLVLLGAGLLGIAATRRDRKTPKT